DKLLDRFDRAVGVQPGDNDIAAELLAAVPRAMPGDQGLVLILLREHLRGVEAHPERRRMRTQPNDRRSELVAAVAPAELRVRYVAAAAVREAEIVLAGVSEPVEL